MGLDLRRPSSEVVAEVRPLVRSRLSENRKTFTRSEHFPKNHGSRCPTPPPERPTEVYAANPGRSHLRPAVPKQHASTRPTPLGAPRCDSSLGRAQPTHLVYCSYVEVEPPHRSRLVVLGCKHEQRGQRGRQRGALSLDASAHRSATRLRSRATRRRLGSGAERSGIHDS